MAATAKPVAGQPIESAWGGQVHDAAVKVRGVVVTGAQNGTAAAKLPLDTVLAGDAAMVDLVSDEFVAPQDGVYEITANVDSTGQAVAAGNGYFAYIYVNAALGAGGSTYAAGGSARRYMISWIGTMLAGQRAYVQNAGPGSGGTQGILRASFRLLGQEIG